MLDPVLVTLLAWLVKTSKKESPLRIYPFSCDWYSQYQKMIREKCWLALHLLFMGDM